MKTFPRVLLVSALLFCCSRSTGAPGQRPAQPANPSSTIFGFRDSAAEMNLESRYLAVPDPKLAEEHLRTLTQAPHIAGTPEDRATADYVAQKLREAGLEIGRASCRERV